MILHPLKLICLIFLSSFTTIVSANSIDSLLAALKVQDTAREKFSLYHEVISYYLQIDLNQANTYTDSLCFLAMDAGADEDLVKVFGYKQYIAFEQGEFESAVNSLKQERFYNIKTQNEFSEATYNRGLGMVFYHQQLLDSAIYYFTRADSLYAEKYFYQGVSEMKIKIGACNYYIDQYDKALTNYIAAKGIIEEHTNDTLGLINILNNIGLVFSYYQNSDKALSYYNEALELAKTVKAILREDMLYFNMGDAYVVKEDIIKATEYYRKSLVIKKENNIPYGTNLARLGYCFYQDGEHDAIAERYLLDAILELEKVGNTFALKDTYEFLGELYMEANRPKKALKAKINAVNSIGEASNGDGFLNLYTNIIQLSFQLKEYKQAQHYTLLKYNLQDSIARQNIIDKVYELETNHQLENKANQISLLNSEKELQNLNNEKLWLFSILLILLLCITVLFILYKARRTKELQLSATIELEHNNLKLQHAILMRAKQELEHNEFIESIDKSSSKVLRKVKNSNRISKSWNEYLDQFEDLNAAFFANIQNMAIKLSAKEIRLCALILKGLTISEIAHILKVQNKSVEAARSRLRKKLNLTKTDDLYIILANYNK